MASETWDQFADSYGRQVWLERAAVRHLLDLVSPTPTDRLLDIGTGPGVVLATLADKAERPTEAIGIDASDAMLRRVPALPPGWRTEQADATDLPFDEASFDVVSASYLLHILDAGERSAAIAEAARVLRPGGRFGAVTVAPPRSAVGRFLTAPLRFAAERSDGRFRGMRPLDPRPELERAGLAVTASTRTFRGYPSLVVVAERTASA